MQFGHLSCSSFTNSCVQPLNVTDGAYLRSRSWAYLRSTKWVEDTASEPLGVLRALVGACRKSKDFKANLITCPIREVFSAM